MNQPITDAAKPRDTDVNLTPFKLEQRVRVTGITILATIKRIHHHTVWVLYDDGLLAAVSDSDLTAVSEKKPDTSESPSAPSQPAPTTAANPTTGGDNEMAAAIGSGVTQFPAQRREFFTVIQHLLENNPQALQHANEELSNLTAMGWEDPDIKVNTILYDGRVQHYRIVTLSRKAQQPPLSNGNGHAQTAVAPPAVAPSQIVETPEPIPAPLNALIERNPLLKSVLQLGAQETFAITRDYIFSPLVTCLENLRRPSVPPMISSSKLDMAAINSLPEGASGRRPRIDGEIMEKNP